MKKTLATLMAAAIAVGSSVVAFAAPTTNNYEPGTSISIGGTSFGLETDDLSKNDFTVSAKWKVGGAMVEGVKIDSTDKTVHVIVKENYTLDTAKALEGTITLKSKIKNEEGQYPEYTLNMPNDDVEVTISNKVDNAEVWTRSDDAEDNIWTVADDTIYEAESSGYTSFGDGSRLVRVTARVSEGQKFFGFYDEAAIDSVEDKYADGDAEIDYINFVARPTFSKGAKVVFDRNFSDKGYIYEYSGNKLIDLTSKAKWNSEDGTWTLDTTKLGSYVFSDKKLESVSADDSSSEEDSSNSGSSKPNGGGNTTEPNPGTGASDFVGLAVALAAVSTVGIAVAKRK